MPARPIKCDTEDGSARAARLDQAHRLSHEEAARLLALSVHALRKNLYDVHPVGAQTERIAELIDRLGDRAPIAAEPMDIYG